MGREFGRARGCSWRRLEEDLMGYTAVLVLMSPSLANVLHMSVSTSIKHKRYVLTDLTTVDLAIVAGWKLKGLSLFFFSGVAGVK